MAISFINGGTPTQANSSPQSPGIPTNTAAGDLMLLFCEQTSAAGITFTPPAGGGWTSIARNSNATRAMTLEVFAKTAVGGDTAPSVACSSAAGGWQAAIGTWRGVNTAIVEDNTEVASDSAAAATWQPTGITLNTAGSCVVSVVATKDDNALNFNTANGYTERLDGATYDGTAGNGSDYSLGVADQVFGSTGAKTCPTWKQSANGNDAWVGLTIALLAATDTTVSPSATTVTITGSAPTVTATQNVLAVPSSGSVTVTGATPSVLTPVAVAPSSSTVTISGGTPAVLTPVDVAPDAPTVTITGSTPTVLTPVLVEPDAETVTITGDSPDVALPVLVEPDADTITVTGSAPGVAAGNTVDTLIQPSAGSVTVTGATPYVGTPVLVLPIAGAVSVSGAVPTVVAEASWVIVPLGRTITISGGRPKVRVLSKTALAGAWELTDQRLPHPQQVAPRSGHVGIAGGIPDVHIIDDGDIAALLAGLA